MKSLLVIISFLRFVIPTREGNIIAASSHSPSLSLKCPKSYSSIFMRTLHYSLKLLVILLLYISLSVPTLLWQFLCCTICVLWAFFYRSQSVLLAFFYRSQSVLLAFFYRSLSVLLPFFYRSVLAFYLRKNVYGTVAEKTVVPFRFHGHIYIYHVC